MKDIKLMLPVFVLALAMLTTMGASQDSWNLSSPDDWLSTGPVYHSGPYYYPNSDLSTGTQRFLNTYPDYIQLGYSNYYQNYNPYFYNPQAGLDRAVANHAFQKFLTEYNSRYYGYYGSYQ